MIRKPSVRFDSSRVTTRVFDAGSLFSSRSQAFQARRDWDETWARHSWEEGLLVSTVSSQSLLVQYASPRSPCLTWRKENSLPSVYRYTCLNAKGHLWNVVRPRCSRFLRVCEQCLFLRTRAVIKFALRAGSTLEKRRALRKFSVRFCFQDGKLCFRYTAENFNENPSRRAAEKILRQISTNRKFSASYLWVAWDQRRRLKFRSSTKRCLLHCIKEVPRKFSSDLICYCKVLARLFTKSLLRKETNLTYRGWSR